MSVYQQRKGDGLCLILIRMFQFQIVFSIAEGRKIPIRLGKWKLAILSFSAKRLARLNHVQGITPENTTRNSPPKKKVTDTVAGESSKAMNKLDCGKCKHFRLYQGAKYDGFCTVKAGNGVDLLSYTIIRGCKEAKKAPYVVATKSMPERCKESPDREIQQSGIILKIRNLFN